MRHSTLDTNIHLVALFLAVTLSIGTWVWDRLSFLFPPQVEVPQGVVICDQAGPSVVLGGKLTYTPQEWDYIQRRAFEAFQNCNHNN